MYATRFLQLLFIALVGVCTVLASHNARNADPYVLVARQTDASSDDSEVEQQTSAGGDESSPVTSAPPPPTSTPDDQESSSQQEQTSSSEEEQSTPSEEPTSSQPEETSSAPPPSSTPEEQPTSSTPPPESSTPSSEPVESSTRPSSDNNNDNTSSEEEQSSTPPPSSEPVTSTAWTTITTTNSDGSNSVITSATETHTSDPGLADGDGNSNDNGLTEENKKIVIGVVVGVGGAIILGALGVVAWRIRNRRKLAEENAGLMEFDEAGKSEPGGTSPTTPPQSQGQGAPASQRSPFQSTLDTYHQPNVNASSNF